MRDARAGHLPNYSFYSPNVFNDGHDTSLEISSAWLSNFVQSFQGTLGMHQRTLLVVTWDEGGDEDFHHNQRRLVGHLLLRRSSSEHGKVWDAINISIDFHAHFEARVKGMR